MKRFECKTPFEFDIAFAVFIPSRLCVWSFGVYVPLLSLYSLLAPLAAHIFAYVYVHPFMGFQRMCTCIPLWNFWPFRRRVKPYEVFMPFRRRVKPYGFFIPFRGEWRHLGFSVRFAAMDTFWVLGIIRGVKTITCVFDRLSIYLFLYSLIYLNIYLFVYLFIFYVLYWLIDFNLFIHSFISLVIHSNFNLLIIYLFID